MSDTINSYKYLIIFRKHNLMRFISHLDLLRVFKRAIKRAELPLAYSQGFNPHPKLGFAQPLTLGFIGENEVAEVVLNDKITANVVKDILNKTLPKGIEIKRVFPVSYSLSAASDLRSAMYIVELPEELSYIDDKELKNFLSQDAINVLKFQKKKGYKEVDIKDKIQDLSLISINNSQNLAMTLPCGSQSNLNPQLVVTALFNYLNVSVDIKTLKITRTQLYFDKLEEIVNTGK